MGRVGGYKWLFIVLAAIIAFLASGYFLAVLAVKRRVESFFKDVHTALIRGESGISRVEGGSPLTYDDIAINAFSLSPEARVENLRIRFHGLRTRVGLLLMRYDFFKNQISLVLPDGVELTGLSENERSDAQDVLCSFSPVYAMQFKRNLIVQSIRRLLGMKELDDQGSVFFNDRTGIRCSDKSGGKETVLYNRGALELIFDKNATPSGSVFSMKVSADFARDKDDIGSQFSFVVKGFEVNVASDSVANRVVENVEVRADSIDIQGDRCGLRVNGRLHIPDFLFFLTLPMRNQSMDLRIEVRRFNELVDFLYDSIPDDLPGGSRATVSGVSSVQLRSMLKAYAQAVYAFSTQKGDDRIEFVLKSDGEKVNIGGHSLEKFESMVRNSLEQAAKLAAIDHLRENNSEVSRFVKQLPGVSDSVKPILGDKLVGGNSGSSKSTAEGPLTAGLHGLKTVISGSTSKALEDLGSSRNGVESRLKGKTRQQSPESSVTVKSSPGLSVDSGSDLVDKVQ